MVHLGGTWGTQVPTKTRGFTNLHMSSWGNKSHIIWGHIDVDTDPPFFVGPQTGVAGFRPSVPRPLFTRIFDEYADEHSAHQLHIGSEP